MKRMIKMENQKKKKEILKLCPCNCTKKIDASKKQENILFDETLIIFWINSIFYIIYCNAEQPQKQTRFQSTDKKFRS